MTVFVSMLTPIRSVCRIASRRHLYYKDDPYAQVSNGRVPRAHDARHDARNPSRHLLGSTPRERQQHDAMWISAIHDEMRDAMGKRVGFA